MSPFFYAKKPKLVDVSVLRRRYSAMKKFLLFIFAVLLLVFISIYFYMVSTKPSYDGKLELQGLSGEVIVKYDARLRK